LEKTNQVHHENQKPASPYRSSFHNVFLPALVRIIRMEDNKLKIIKIDLDKIKNGELSDVSLKPGDRIHIPESWL